MAQAAGYRTPRYLTFKQALELGGHVRRGAKGTKVYFVKQLQVRDEDLTAISTRRASFRCCENTASAIISWAPAGSI
jgi:antirestriction protein ArdC